jgi:methylornithine synthase
MKSDNAQDQLVEILAKADEEEILNREDLGSLLSVARNNQIDAVFRAARQLRQRYFGDMVFLYGFIYVSTFCRNHCNFCYYRNTNTLPVRYRLDESEIIGAARRLAESGTHLIDLTLGEDPDYGHDDESGLDKLARLVKAVREATDLPVMVSPGVVPTADLVRLVQAGAGWYACYQETHNRDLFKRLRPGQSYAARLKNKLTARKLGLLIEEGILCGVGESLGDIAESIEVMRCLDASQVRAMSFVPQQGTPMARRKTPDSLQELLIIAALRLALPDRLIPATLDVDGLKGLRSRLEAGANVITSLVPPGFGLAGVAQNSLDIAEAKRTASSIRPVLERLNLRAAAAEDYQNWMQTRRAIIGEDPRREKIAC